MSISLATEYAGATESATAAYPGGAFRNESAPDALDGTPLEKEFFNDVAGFMQSILAAAGASANGSPDSVENPQILEALLGVKWSTHVDYATGARVRGSNNVWYVAQSASGPSSTSRDPVSSNAAYWRTETAHMANLMYPVGAYYTSSVATAPATLFGMGTWVQVSGRVLIGVDSGDSDFNAANKTGGSKTHTHTVSRDGWGTLQSGGNLPEPTTSGRLVTGSGDVENDENLSSLGMATTNPDSGSTSGLPPYNTAYMWRRTA